jgi:hypothetical protein
MGKCALLIYILLVFSLFTPDVLKGQECRKRLDLAPELYSNGNLNELIDTLKECTVTGNQSIKFQALRWTAMAHLVLEESDDAKKAAMRMLHIYPTYEPSLLNDPSDLVKLLNSILVIPKFSLGISFSAGANITNAQVSKVYNIAQQSNTEYRGKSGLIYGIDGAYQFKKKWAIYFSLYSLEKRNKIRYSIDHYNMTTDEFYRYLNMPIGVRYQYSFSGNWVPFAQVGVYASYLIDSYTDFNSFNNLNEIETSLTSYNMRPFRNDFDFGGQIGLGIIRNIGRGELTVSFNYNHSLSNLSNGKDRQSINQVGYRYFHMDDDHYLHTYSLQVGYKLFLNYKVVK